MFYKNFYVSVPVHFEHVYPDNDELQLSSQVLSGLETIHESCQSCLTEWIFFGIIYPFTSFYPYHCYHLYNVRFKRLATTSHHPFKGHRVTHEPVAWFSKPIWPQRSDFFSHRRNDKHLCLTITPLKINMEPKNHPHWRGKSSSKSLFWGSM